MRLISNTTKHLLIVTQGNLDKHLLSKNKFKPKLEALSLTKVIESAVHIMKIKAETSEVNLEFEGLLTGDKQVMIDKSRTHQILINLIDNAIKFSFRGGTVLVKIE